MLSEYPIDEKRVLVRVDYNVPLKEGKITDDKKILASLPTIKYLLSHDCKVILMTHLGDPKGKVVQELKTDVLAKELQINFPKNKIVKLDDCIGKEIKQQIEEASNKNIFLLENLRFYKEEEENDTAFAHSLADLAEVYVNDGFAVSHRKHASISAITGFIPAVSGLLMEKEVSNLSLAFKDDHPNVWVMGGAKLDKIDLVNAAMQRADVVLIGGALAFAFLKAQGINVGMSKIDANSIPVAKQLLDKYKDKIVLPMDFIVTEEFNMNAHTTVAWYNKISNNQIALDIGPGTIDLFQRHLQTAKLVVWNGPLGYFEWAKFANGTMQIARYLGKLNVIKIAGGGETSAAISKFNLVHNFTHVSTGGGAALEFLSGKKMPGIEALEESYKKFGKKR
jgi:3-phosphoglycerate kinase